MANYWLFKTEPDEFSIDDLESACKPICWDGIRNYQARNLIRDEIRRGDQVLIYHSSCKPTAIVGSALVTSDSYPDPTQFNPYSPGYDPKSSTDKPRWFSVDIEHQKTLAEPLTLKTLKSIQELADMVLFKQGRLSIQPVSELQFSVILNGQC